MLFYNMTEEDIVDFKQKRFWKFFNEKENHYGLQYHDGLVEDPLPFNPTGDCEEGGIYVASEDILAFVDYGSWLREVTFPEDAQIYRNPGTLQKWKADKVILGPRRRFTLEVLQELETQGADIHADDDAALRWAATNGHLDVVKYLIEHGTNIHARDDAALRWAAGNGHLDIVKYLVEHGADIHVYNDHALRWAAGNEHLDVVKFLVEHGADIHARDDYALRWAAINGHDDIVQYLQTHL